MEETADAFDYQGNVHPRCKVVLAILIVIAHKFKNSLCRQSMKWESIVISAQFKQSCSLSKVKIQPDEKSSNISNVGTKNMVPVLGVLKSNNLS